MRNTVGLKTAAIITAAAFAMAAVVYLALDIHRRSENQVAGYNVKQQKMLAAEAAASIGGMLDERRHHLQLLGIVVNGTPLANPQDVIELYTAEEQVSGDRVDYIDATGRVIASTESLNIGRDDSRMDWFKAARNAKDTSVIALTHLSRGPEGQSFQFLQVLPLRRGPGRAPAGLLTVTIDVASIVPDLVKDSDGEHVTMIDSRGVILYQSRIPGNVAETVVHPRQRCYKCHESFRFVHSMQDQRSGAYLHPSDNRLASFAFASFSFDRKPVLLILGRDRAASAFLRQTSIDTILLLLAVALIVVLAATAIFRGHRERVQTIEEARQWKEKSALEAALRRAEQHYRTIVETSHDAIWILDAEQRFTFVNRRTEETTGYEPEELLGRTIGELLSDAHREALARTLSDVEDRGSADLELKVLRKDGSAVILETSCVRVASDTGAGSVIFSARDVTQRREAELALRRSEKQYEQLVDSVPGIVWRADAKTIEFDLVSEQARDILGYEPNQWLHDGSFWVDHLHPDDREWAPRFCADESRQGKRHQFDYRMIAADGRIVWLHDVVNVEMEDGEPKTLSGVMIDVTSSKTAEIALRNSEERFRTTFEQASLGIILRDSRWQILEVNPAIVALLGYSVDELRTLLPGDLAHPDDRDFVIATMRNLWSGATQPSHVQFRYRRKDGSFLWARVTLSLIRDVDGNPTMSVALLEDMSEQIQATQERMRLATAIEHAGEAVVVTDARGRIEYVNPAFEAITGFMRYEVTGRTPALLKSGQHDDEFYRSMWGQITQGETWTGRMVNRRKNGSSYEAEATISPMYSPAGQISGYVAVQRDVTEHIALLEKLRRAEEIQALGKLVGGVAHEVRNPLGAIQAALGALELDLGDLPEHAPFFNIIRSQVDRLTRLMRELLDLGKPLQEARVGVHSLSDICESSIAVWRHSNPQEPARRVRFDRKARVATARVDPSRLQQVIVNLLDNAMQHSSQDSTIVVTTGDAGDECRITVRDSGTGIENAAITRIFDPFFTTRKGGTGLGLSLVRNIVEQHGGRISVYNNDPPPGTTAQVSLPLAVSREEALA